MPFFQIQNKFRSVLLSSLISVLWKKRIFWSKLSEVSWLIFEFQLEIWAHTWVAWRQNGLFWEELHFIKFCNSFSGIYQWNQMELNWRSLSLMSLSSQSKISFKLQYYYHRKLVKEKKFINHVLIFVELLCVDSLWNNHHWW